MMIKFRSKKYFCRSSSKLSRNDSGGNNKLKGGDQKDSSCGGNNVTHEIKWELRPGGMLVQRRETAQSVGEGMITIRVSAVSQWHDISIEATSTFGELKMVLSLMTGLEPKEQRLLFKGKERDDGEYLHMVGVRDKDKVLLLQDPAIKEMKLLSLAGGQPITNYCPTITQSKAKWFSLPSSLSLSLVSLSNRSSLAARSNSDSRPNLSVATSNQIPKDIQGFDNPIPLSPQLPPLLGMAHQEVANNSPEITEPATKLPKLRQNGVVEAFSFFKVKKLSDRAVLPSRGSPFSAGYDLSSAIETKVPARGKALVPTDLSIAVPEGTYARVAPRSGLAWKHSIGVGAGVIDADYRGPVGVILFNLSDVDFEVQVGDRIAQLIIEKIITPDIVEVEDLDATVRGSGGFGSTGV